MFLQDESHFFVRSHSMPLLQPPNDLCEYLGKAVAYPRLLNTGSSREGATLALAVHCLFI